MASSLNPNFWLCTCDPPGNVHSLFEMQCSKCKTQLIQAEKATQQQVNNHADWVAKGQKTAASYKPTLPEQRKKPIPTREDFEAALDWLEKDDASKAEWKARGWYTHPQSSPSKRPHYEMIVKRYKALA